MRKMAKLVKFPSWNISLPEEISNVIKFVMVPSIWFVHPDLNPNSLFKHQMVDCTKLTYSSIALVWATSHAELDN